MFATRGRLPVIQQSEVAECGLACMTMLARYHGHDVDLASLRRRFGSSLHGTTLSSLVSIGDRLGMSCRPLRVELEFLPKLRLPCILHWNLSHFVVLKRVTRRGLHIHDPAIGARFVSMQEVSQSFTGIALELTPSADFRPETQRRRLSLSTVIGSIKGLRGALVQVLCLAFVLELLTLCLPLAMQWVLDSVLVSGDLSLLTVLGIGFLFVVIFQSSFLVLRGWLIAGIGSTLVAQWITNLASHMLRLPLDFFERRSVGEIMSRYDSVHAVQHTLSGSVIGAMLDGLTLVLLLVVLSLYSPSLTAVVVLATGAYGLLRWLSFASQYRLREQRLTHVAQRHSRILECIRGAMSIKLANRADERLGRIANAAVEVANRDAAVETSDAVFTALSRLIFGAQRIVLLWMGALLTLNNQFSVGMLVVFIAYAEVFAGRASAFVDHFTALRMLSLHAERIADIALEPAESDVHSGYSGPKPVPVIEFRKVKFRYADDQPWILNDCSFKIEAGASVAIAGASGCGKTTLAKILLGLLQPTEGSVLIGGLDIRQYGLAAYRELFGCVMQEDHLLAGSLAENIAFFDAAADADAIQAAAHAACIHDDIVAMTMGYESAVGDMGSALSGGQKQRVLLARALYRQPSIMLLDEATSHLDVQRERQINARIAQLKMTRILIAHRPETIASAERVLLLDAGRVVDDTARDATSKGICNLELAA